MKIRKRRIDQYVVPLPTNGQVWTNLATQIHAGNPGIPAHRIKIKLDDNGYDLLVSVPSDWAAEDAAARGAHGVDEGRV